jgi:hypothetical protein
VEELLKMSVRGHAACFGSVDVLEQGTRPGRTMLKYESVAPPSTVQTTIAEFLRQTGFSEKSADSDYEWWTDRHTEFGLSIRGAGGGSHVEILHNTGSD